MSKYIEFKADRLLADLGHEKVRCAMLLYYG